MMNLIKLIKFYDSASLPEAEIKLDVCTTITDCEKFVENHISFLVSNPGKRAYLGYYNRILKLHDILTQV